tara:strand:- start:166 stop:453 length:288 start_codon:yes stop_codon:yes gene_type:complete
MTNDQDYASPYDIAQDHPDWNHAMGMAFYMIDVVLTEQVSMHDVHYSEMRAVAIELAVDSIMNQTMITKDKAYLAMGYEKTPLTKYGYDCDIMPF